jgi:hypothetical protein
MSLMDLVNEWEHSARRRFMDAKNSEGVEKRGLEDGAIIYANCARELKKALIGDNDLVLISLPAEIAELVTKVQAKYTLDKDYHLNCLFEKLAKGSNWRRKFDLSELTNDELQTLLNLAEKTNKTSGG